MNKRTYVIKKRNGSRNKWLNLIIVGLVVISFVVLLVLQSGGGEIETVLSDVEDAYGFSELDYSEILYYYKSETGPFGENNRFLIIQLDEKSQDEVQAYYEEQDVFCNAPMRKDILTWMNEIINGLNINNSMPELSSGFYAFYDKEAERILSMEEVDMCMRAENLTLMHRYILLQYSVEDGKMYIFEYS